jgi:hypothetical protein
MFLGSISLIGGLMLLWYLRKYPNREENDYGKGQFKGYIAAAAFILIGIVKIIEVFGEYSNINK